MRLLPGNFDPRFHQASSGLGQFLLLWLRGIHFQHPPRAPSSPVEVLELHSLWPPCDARLVAEWRTDRLAMFRRQWSIIVRVLSHMGGNEQFPRDLSDSIDDLAGFEESFRNQGLDHSFSFTCEIHGSWSSLQLSPVG